MPKILKNCQNGGKNTKMALKHKKKQIFEVSKKRGKKEISLKKELAHPDILITFLKTPEDS